MFKNIYYFFSDFLWKKNRLLFYILAFFSCLHFFSWSHYFTSRYGWIEEFSFFDNLFFLPVSLLYWLIYSSLIILSYSYGKKTFLFIISLFLISFSITIPFGLAGVDLDVKFILLLKSNFEWNYIRNYLVWIIGSIILFLPFLIFSLVFISKKYNPSIQLGRKFKITTLFLFFFLIIWNIILHGPIDTEVMPKLYYDNEIGRVTRGIFALSFRDFKVFNFKELEGNFKLYENYSTKKEGIHGVFAFLDTLEYEFLSIHGNSNILLNKNLEKYINDGKMVDMGIVYSCGSHTTASTPNMMSWNNCRLGPNFHNEPIMHLIKRINGENHYLGLPDLSKYFSTAFMDESKVENRHYVTDDETSHGLSLAAKDLLSYPVKPTTFTMIYYDAVHPGLSCSFLMAGGFPKSVCQGNTFFNRNTYKYGMGKAVEIIEKDIVSFMDTVENDSKPIFLLVTADHGLSPNFLHGDMADSDVSLKNVQEATQRHTNVLIYGNKAYRSLRSMEWKNLESNSKKYSGYLNHEILFPTMIHGMGIEWDKGKDYLSKYSVFSSELHPQRKTKTLMNKYLTKKN